MTYRSNRGDCDIYAGPTGLRVQFLNAPRYEGVFSLTLYSRVTGQRYDALVGRGWRIIGNIIGDEDE